MQHKDLKGYNRTIYAQHWFYFLVKGKPQKCTFCGQTTRVLDVNPQP